MVLKSKGWMEKGSIMMCKIKGQMEEGGHYKV